MLPLFIFEGYVMLTLLFNTPNQRILRFLASSSEYEAMPQAVSLDRSKPSLKKTKDNSLAILAKSAILFTLFSFALVTANADPISTSVSCNVAGQSTVSTSGCSGPNYSGSASAGYTIFGNTLTFDISSAAEVFSSSTDIVDALASLNLNVYSTSYVGSAYVVFNGSIKASGTQGGFGSEMYKMTPGYYTYELGNGYGTYPTTGPGCGFGHPGDGSPVCDTTQPVALQLGAGNFFNFSAESDTQAPLPLEFSVGDVTGTLSFFEADGTTPLDITLAPEPSSIALAGLGLALCGMGFVKRRQARLASSSENDIVLDRRIM